jgi:hypothetical protein
VTPKWCAKRRISDRYRRPVALAAGFERPLGNEPRVFPDDPDAIARVREPGPDAPTPPFADRILARDDFGQVHGDGADAHPQSPRGLATCAARALAIIVFVGVQPVFEQVPPSSAPSKSATFSPASAKRIATGVPAWPLPTMMTSVSCMGCAWRARRVPASSRGSIGRSVCDVLSLLRVADNERHRATRRGQAIR